MTDHDDAHVCPAPMPDPQSARRERGLTAMSGVLAPHFGPVFAERVAYAALVEARRCGSPRVRIDDAMAAVVMYESYAGYKLLWRSVRALGREIAAAWRAATKEVTP